MKNVLLNLVDFIGKRINSPPYILPFKLFLIKYERVYSDDVFGFSCKINLKKMLNMEKTVLILILMLSSVTFLFSQEARINGFHSDFITPGPNLFVCSGDSILLSADLVPSGTINNYVWRQRVWNSGTLESDWTTVDIGSANIYAPYNGAANDNYLYDYQLIIISGGGSYQTYFRIAVDLLPTVVLSGDKEICQGENVTFNASAGGTTYDFKVGGVSQYSGPNSSWSSSTLANGDQVTVTVTSGSCSATSAPIVMTVRPRSDATSVTPSSTCNGEAMDWTYQGLTGTGPWIVSFWNPTHTIQYGPDYNVSTSNGSLPDVPIPYGTSNVHFKIQDQYCPNF